MVDLKQIEDRLNSDKEFREKFFADPAAVLRSEGIELGEHHIDKIKRMVADINNPQLDIAGSNLAGGGKAEWSIGIGKSWSF